jgi:ribosome-associated heat shock protein Hsp15
VNKHKTTHTTEIDAIRLDKWLWVARFYKTRKLAAEAIAGGKVHLNGQRSKPGKEVKIGAQLFITKDLYQWDITLISLAKHRRPAKEALLLYQESQDSMDKRQKQTQHPNRAKKEAVVKEETAVATAAVAGREAATAATAKRYWRMDC